ncbi:MAG: hypothetical protein LAQ69_38670 [Acidobacteriia bacterium]|nr:hypothetical protein [Terriglobia bacterium]
MRIPNEKAPLHPLPAHYVPPFSLRHPVKDREDWGSVARMHRIDTKALIFYNFWTTNPDEVNWYLRRNVGCTKSNDGGRNYAFSSDARPGYVYYPPPPVPAKTLMPEDRMPGNLRPHFNSALDGLQIQVMRHYNPRNAGLLCWIGKLKDPNVKDEVIRWHRICPRGGASGAAYVVGGCPPGDHVSETDLMKYISSDRDVLNANERLKFMTHVRSDILVSHDLIRGGELESFYMLFDEVRQTTEKLDAWYEEDTGMLEMPSAYKAIKDWIAAREKDQDSLYSCIR